MAGTVHFDPDVRTYFPDSESVNVPLRGLIARIPAQRRATQPQQEQAFDPRSA